MSLMSVPSACIRAISSAFSASLPSHQWMRSGLVSDATEATQWLRASSALGAGLAMAFMRGPQAAVVGGIGGMSVDMTCST